MAFLERQDTSTEDLERYFRALRRAQCEIDLEAERYKHFWERELPEELRYGIDVRRVGRGERILFEPYTREMDERTRRWMERRPLFDPTAAVRAAYGEAVIA